MRIVNRSAYVTGHVNRILVWATLDVAPEELAVLDDNVLIVEQMPTDFPNLRDGDGEAFPDRYAVIYLREGYDRRVHVMHDWQEALVCVGRHEVEHLLHLARERADDAPKAALAGPPDPDAPYEPIDWELDIKTDLMAAQAAKMIDEALEADAWAAGVKRLNAWRELSLSERDAVKLGQSAVARFT